MKPFAVRSIAVLGIWIMLFSSCTFFRPRPHSLYKKALQEEPFDAIIVPGFPYNGSDWTFAMKSRVLWAAYLYKQGLAKNIIFSGAAVYSPYVESKVMALYAQELGVPKENIFIEERAQHSTENVYYSYELARELEFKKLAIASDPVQSNLLMGFTKRRLKNEISFIPYTIDKLSAIDTVYPCITADSAFVDNFQSIVHTQSLFKRIKGTWGLNINYVRQDKDSKNNAGKTGGGSAHTSPALN